MGDTLLRLGGSVIGYGVCRGLTGLEALYTRTETELPVDNGRVERVEDGGRGDEARGDTGRCECREGGLELFREVVEEEFEVGSSRFRGKTSSMGSGSS